MRCWPIERANPVTGSAISERALADMKEQPALREHRTLAMEAVDALARMDADRLEDLARRCRALDAGPERATVAGFANLGRDLAALMRILEATRGNAGLLQRLRGLGSSEVEYRCEPDDGWYGTRSGNGHDSIGV